MNVGNQRAPWLNGFRVNGFQRQRFSEATLLRSINWITLGFACLLIAWAVAGRFLIETPNFKPLGAAALLAGFLLRDWRWAIAVPLVSLFVSDLWLGGYQWGVALAVYGSTAIYGLLGCFGRAGSRQQRDPACELRGARGAACAIGLATLGSVQFFLLTNLAVWRCSGWYGLTWTEGLSCFVAAFPFYKWTLLSDLSFFAAPLMAWYLVVQPWLERAGSKPALQPCHTGRLSQRG